MRLSVLFWFLIGVLGLSFLPPASATSLVEFEQTVTKRERLSFPLCEFEGALCGYIAPDGQYRIQPRFTDVAPFSRGRAWAKLHNDWGMIDPSGKRLGDARFPVAGSLFNGRWSAVRTKDGATLISENGTELRKIKFDQLLDERVYDGSAKTVEARWTRVIKSNGQLGLIDRDWKQIAAPQFEQFGHRSGDLVQVQKNGLWGVWSINARSWQVEPKFQVKFPMRATKPVLINTKEKSFLYANPVGTTIADSLHVKRAYWSRKTAGWVRKEKLWGLMSDKGSYILPPGFKDKGLRFNETSWVVRTDGDKTGIINEDGTWVLKPQKTIGYIGSYDLKNLKDGGIPVMVESCFLLRCNYVAGYIGQNGEWLVSPRFDKAQPFSDGLARVYIGRRYRYISRSGKYAFRSTFIDARDFSEGLAFTKEGNKWGIIRKDGTWRVSPKFDGVEANFKNGLAWVHADGKLLSINPRGTTRLVTSYDRIVRRTKEYFIFSSKKLLGVAAQSGKVILPPQYNEIILTKGAPFVNLRKGAVWGLAKLSNGELLLPIQEKSKPLFFWSERDEFEWLQQGQLWGLLSKSGRWVFQPQFTQKSWITEDGRAEVEKDGKLGIITTKGTWYLPAKYEAISRCCNKGMYAAKLQGKWGVLDADGQWILPPKSTEEIDFDSDYAQSKRLDALSGRPLVLNYEGKLGALLPSMSWSLPPRFDAIGDFKDGVAPARSGKFWGYIDTKGKWIVEPKFDKAATFSGSLGLVKFGRQSGYVDSSGRYLTFDEAQLKAWRSTNLGGASCNSVWSVRIVYSGLDHFESQFANIRTPEGISAHGSGAVRYFLGECTKGDYSLEHVAKANEEATPVITQMKLNHNGEKKVCNISVFASGAQPQISCQPMD